MLLSMTGFGAGRAAGPGGSCAVEIRSVNNRFLKIACRLPESHANLEGPIEKFMKDKIRRGTLSVFVRITREGGPPQFRINQPVLQGYLDQLRPWSDSDSLIGHLLALPGVVDESGAVDDSQQIWSVVEQALAAAIDNLEKMRRDEGLATERELSQIIGVVTMVLDKIDQLTPLSVRAYRDRLHERVSSLLAELGATVGPADLIKEVSIFAERCDIAEETSRLRSHVNQFSEIIRTEPLAGRKLDFLTQEMYREANTMGAKANDAAVSELTVELKSQIERAREIVQNVE